ncbi:hypothetical protein [Phenylobacterium aquaticum]|uniref:hypothetical protein n=1 Tax=Phenylobacterium aquaticum TaxID=1763816 RepID=UPI001F5C3B25|nr:hypothetical protein [Phenylobacterium aquaticum]MCI3131676.1 hypothetical protein [Phenylobacterium aquaticum]
MDAKLTLAQSLKAVACGLSLWFIGALVVQFGRPIGLFGPHLAILYLASVLLIPASIMLVKRIAGLADGAQYVTGVALGTAAAIVWDGLLIAFAPGLYGGPGEGLAQGAAWILFAGALGFVPPLVSLFRSR